MNYLNIKIMKQVLLLAFILYSSVCFSQNSTLKEILVGSWKTNSLNFQNKFYHNFDNDSIAVYDTVALSNMIGSAYLKDRIIWAAKKYTSSFLETFQFNADYICTVSRSSRDVVRYTFSVDESAMKLTFVGIEDKTNTFQINVTNIDKDTVAFQFILNKGGYTSTLKRVVNKLQ